MNDSFVYSISEACAIARVGRTALYEAVRDGSLIIRKRGRRSLVLADDLRKWIESLPTFTPNSKS